MKMDATLKRRMWAIALVTITHLVLSVWFGVLVVYHQAMAGGIFEDSFFVWGNFDLKVFCLLQPQFWLAFIYQPEISENYDYLAKFVLAVSNFSQPLLISMPFWSICFGFIFTKAFSWRTRHSSPATYHS
jgi:hypothetical protein